MFEPRCSVPFPSSVFAAMVATAQVHGAALVWGSALVPGPAAEASRVDNLWERFCEEWREYGGHFGPQTEAAQRVRPWLRALNLTPSEMAEQRWLEAWRAYGVPFIPGFHWSLAQ